MTIRMRMMTMMERSHVIVDRVIACNKRREKWNELINFVF